MLSIYITHMFQLVPIDANWKKKLPRYRVARSKTSFQASRKRLEASRAALAESENRLRTILGNTTEHAVFTLDSQGRVTTWNTGAARILGWTEANIVGLNGAVLYTRAEREAGEPAVEMRNAAAKGHVHSERWILRGDGTRFWAAQTLTPLLGKDGEERGFLKILRDRTARHRAETVLAQSEARLQRLYGKLEAATTQRAMERDRIWQLSRDLLMVASPDARLVSVNPAWSALLGWTEDELVGQFALDLVHPDDQQITLAEVSRLAAGLPVECFLNRHRHRDGSWRWLTWTAVADGGLIYATGRDVTDERAASKLPDLMEEPPQQLHRMETMSRLTGCLAHDFNNVLQGIGSNLEMVQLRLEQGRAAEAGRYVETAHKGVDQAAALTVRLLAFARRQ